MKRGKQSYRERAERKLLELWEPSPDFGPAIGCVATTFTFDAAFFEEECLARFAGVQCDPSDNDRVYVIEREEKLSQCFAAVIVDQSHVPTHRSLRWQVLSARVQGGIQHAKLTVLVWEHRIRMLIGSANLTAPGYRKNYENVAVLEFGPNVEDPTPLEPLDQALEFLDQLREVAAGFGSDIGPQAGLERFLNGVRRQIRNWPRPTWPRSQPRAVLLPIRPGHPSLFQQLDLLATGSPYHTAWVQSPFFDDGDRAKRVVGGLEAILAQRGERTIWFAAPGMRLLDDTVQIAVPEVLREPSHRRLTHRFSFVDGRELDDDGEPTDELRPLHAKSIWLERDDAAIYCVGSSNFTCAGTGVEKKRGNFELNLAYVMTDLSSEFVQICKWTFPRVTDVDLDKDTVSFLVDVDRTKDGTELAGLPLAFGEAMFDPGPPGGVVCQFTPDAPEDFSITGPDGSVLVTAVRWKSLGRPTTMTFPWTSSRPPSYLRVQWQGADGTGLESIWPVNVVDTALLPPPEELRSLDLEELFLVLTSASPPHEIVAKILRRRSETKKSTKAAELDPHRRIDTKGFLLQRMRRFANALEGLRERLERPVYSREALRWRLSGPFGVTALAERLVVEEPQGAAFMMSELAQTLAGVKIAAGGELTSKEATSLVGESLRALQTSAKQHPAPDNLAAYVKRTFEEIVS